MREYVTLSLETHLFFGRLMKEHALFLMAAFQAREAELTHRADRFREKFEDGLRRAVKLADGVVRQPILSSGEAVTEFTQQAECQTRALTGIPIDVKITEEEASLRAGSHVMINRGMAFHVKMLNQHMLSSLDGLISLKEEVFRDVAERRVFASYYPMLIEHMLREAKWYRQNMLELDRKGRVPAPDIPHLKIFWNQMMMEHAQFIHGMLDPTESQLMEAADRFAMSYGSILEEAKGEQRGLKALAEETLQLTKDFRKLKAEGAEGITGGGVRSVILPLLMDHALREANHYLWILQHSF